MRFIPTTIISGAQTGVDRGALEAGIQLGLGIGGFVPRGRRAEDGRVPERYPVVELLDAGYAARTRRNIEVSDATLILMFGYPPTGGTLFTLTECVRLKRPNLLVDLNWKEEAILWNLEQWLATYQPKMLNVAGPRETKQHGIQAETTRILVRAFEDSASSSSTTTR